jgi:hypothetical protein
VSATKKGGEWRVIEVELGSTVRHNDEIVEDTRRTITATVEVEVNLDMLARNLGRRAVRSKSGKAQALHGAVKVAVVTKSERKGWQR